MPRLSPHGVRLLALAALAFPRLLQGQEAAPTVITVVISVADQKMVVLRDGGLVKKFPISTSKFGLGDSFGSYKTPVGKLRVCDKVGDELSIGAVLKQRHATGEILSPNSPGRDPIVTRILWLDGLEEQNANARQRGIYIHGTTEEKRIGEPVSYGCIRMRSKDVVQVFEEIPVDATVTIIPEKLPRFAKYVPTKLPVIEAAPPPKSTPIPATASVALTKATAQTVPALAPVAPAKLAAKTVAASPPELPVNPTATLAFRGSILDAGLPSGPKIPVLPAPIEPKDVPRFNPASPGLPQESAFSLQGIVRDLTPVLRAADADATAREKSAAEKEPAKPAPRIAFRGSPADEEKAKP